MGANRRPANRPSFRHLGRNLRLFRQAKGLSLEELAHQSGLDRTYISSLERSVYSPTIEVVDSLATVLEVMRQSC
jgi:transcriptional regulator with XRE-family HTH domain